MEDACDFTGVHFSGDLDLLAARSFAEVELNRATGDGPDTAAEFDANWNVRRLLFRGGVILSDLCTIALCTKVFGPAAVEDRGGLIVIIDSSPAAKLS